MLEEAVSEREYQWIIKSQAVSERNGATMNIVSSCISVDLVSVIEQGECLWPIGTSGPPAVRGPSKASTLRVLYVLTTATLSVAPV